MPGRDTSQRNSSYANRLLLRVLLFGVVGFLVWWLIGRVATGSVFANPYWGVAVGIFVAALSMLASRRR